MKKKKQKKEQRIVRQLIPKAALALKNEFYFESAMIISTLMETRLKKLILKVENANPGAGFGLERTIKRVKFLTLRSPDSLLGKTFEVRLIDEIREWKNSRNSILKDMVEVHVSVTRLKKLAQDGITLFQELNATMKKFKKEWKKELMNKTVPIPHPDETKIEG